MRKILRGRPKKACGGRLGNLVIPEEPSTLQAGHLPEDLPSLWEKANLAERHTILSGFLECVYVDLKEPASVVGIKTKPQFTGLFLFMNTKSDTPVLLENNSSEP